MYHDKWTKIDEVNNVPGTGYIDYINQKGTLVKRIWNDGYEEIFDIAY